MSYLDYQSIQTTVAVVIGVLIILLTAIAWYQADKEDRRYQEWIEYKRNQDLINRGLK